MRFILQAILFLVIFTQSFAADPPALSKAIDDAAGYLTRVCSERGKFTYRIHLEPGMKVVPRYNVLRHAGTIYALGLANERKPDVKIQETILRATGFLMDKCVGPVKGHPDMLAVWDRADLVLTGSPDCAKLGGAGLGVIAMAAANKVKENTVPLETIEKVGRFILYLQNSDGSFVSKFTPAKGGKDSSFKSLYYPGEAALALAILDELSPNPNWLFAALRALDNLAKKRRGRKRVEADHWALLASAKILSVYKERPGLPSRKSLVKHGEQICNSILQEKAGKYDFEDFKGCFNTDGRTCPTATRMEGLLASLNFIPRRKAGLRAKMRRAVRDGLDFLIRTQVKEGKHRGAIPRAMRRLPAYHRSYNKTFNARALEVRIDYVQHALSAFIAAETLKSQ